MIRCCPCCRFVTRLPWCDMCNVETRPLTEESIPMPEVNLPADNNMSQYSNGAPMLIVALAAFCIALLSLRACEPKINDEDEHAAPACVGRCL
jgi:hypothetical protein